MLAFSLFPQFLPLQGYLLSLEQGRKKRWWPLKVFIAGHQLTLCPSLWRLQGVTQPLCRLLCFVSSLGNLPQRTYRLPGTGKCISFSWFLDGHLVTCLASFWDLLSSTNVPPQVEPSSWPSRDLISRHLFAHNTYRASGSISIWRQLEAAAEQWSAIFWAPTMSQVWAKMFTGVGLLILHSSWHVKPKQSLHPP